MSTWECYFLGPHCHWQVHQTGSTCCQPEKNCGRVEGKEGGHSSGSLPSAFSIPICWPTTEKGQHSMLLIDNERAAKQINDLIHYKSLKFNDKYVPEKTIYECCFQNGKQNTNPFVFILLKSVLRDAVFI